MVEKNKLQYLNLLAQYRLAKCVREEIDHFLKGGKLSPTLFSAVDPDKLFCRLFGVYYNITTYQYHM